jgi:glycosyltransferase involved in cell wall biosynthesis
VLISFIMPARNEARYIGEAIRSLQAASEPNWELKVVDDFSDDATASIVADIGRQDSRVTLIKNRERGKVSAINLGFSCSRGDLIKIIDADDILLPEFFGSVPDMQLAGASCHDYKVVDEQLRPCRTTR